MKTKRNKSGGDNKTLYIWGEIFGKTAVWSTKVAIIAFILGLSCELIWDVKERRARSKDK